MIEKRYDGSSSTPFSKVKIDWSYDAMNRLVAETWDADSTPGDGSDDFGTQDNDDYTDTFAYDVASNRVGRTHDAVGTTEDEAVAYTYNSRDQLTAEDSTDNDNDVEYEYDANGSTTLKSTSAGDTTYTWDLRNRMIAVDAPGTANDAAYTYDSDGVRVKEITSSGTTYYLNDPQNPTGYAKAIEEKSSPTVTTRSYVLGLKVEGQANATDGVRYLLADGHGSTRALVNTSGAVTDSYDYKAFGEAVGFDAATAKTPWLFGGDGVYDPASGWTYHLARWRSGFWFTSMDDPRYGNNADPVTLHKYLYANGNPIGLSDPSGHAVGLICTAISVAEGAATELMKFGAFAMAIGAAGFVFSWAVAYSTSVAMQLVGPESQWWGSLAERHMAARRNMGVFAGVFVVGLAAFTAGAALKMLANIGRSLSDSCFIAGTPVLLGDGYTQLPIEEIHVGQRVATDGGAANSADGKPASDPNSTQVDPTTWRLVTISSQDWQVQTLVPLCWILTNHVRNDTWLPLAAFFDLAEMGVPEGLSGKVEAVSACPPIESGYGRVVLTTVSHLNNFVFDLTLSDGYGNADTVGVTGWHKVYTEDLGWVSASDLQPLQVVRTAYGEAIVAGLERHPGVFRVYNMTVEADHVYYVGDLTALVHNNKCGTYTIGFESGMKYHGKGPVERAIQSALAKMKLYGDKVTSISWKEMKSELAAFIEEARRIAADGGPRRGNYNQINSPGNKYL